MQLLVDYVVLAPWERWLLPLLAAIRPLFRLRVVRNWLRGYLLSKAGSTAEQRERTRTHVWGEVTGEGRKCVARLHGPESGVTWTAEAALAAVEQVLAGQVSCGFQTPARVYGADFVLKCAGVTREDLD